MAIVDDFKDIASRMKGELKTTPEPIKEPLQVVKLKCLACCGSGLDKRGNCCIYCSGSGEVYT